MTASLELSKQLYELAGWYDTAYAHTRQSAVKPQNGDNVDDEICPAYDLGYLLRKLPSGVFIAKGKGFRVWYEDEDGNFPDGLDAYDAATPEDAATILAIRLFEQGLITKEEP